MTDQATFTYEAMFLLDNQEVRTQGFNAVRDWVKTTLEKQGITVKVLRLWGERPLAYSVGQRRRATYLLGWIEASGEAVNAVKRDLYLVGPVFRCMFLRQDEIPEEEAAFGIEEIKDEDLVIPEDEPDFVEEEAGDSDDAEERGEKAEGGEKKPEGEGGEKPAAAKGEGGEKPAEGEAKSDEAAPEPVATASEEKKA